MKLSLKQYFKYKNRCGDAIAFIEKENVDYPKAIYDYKVIVDNWTELYKQYQDGKATLNETVIRDGNRVCEFLVQTDVKDTWFVRTIALMEDF